MSSAPTDEEIGQAILQNVENGTFQLSPELAEAQLPSTAVPALFSGIEKARERVKDEIKTLSKQAAPDIDGWIVRAKQIQQDIERSKLTAHNIVKEAETARKIQARVKDAASKVSLLEKELVFNETLAQTVGQIQGIVATLRHAQDAAVHKKLGRAVERLNEATEAITYLSSFENTRTLGVLQKQVEHLKANIVQDTSQGWNSLFRVDAAEKRITIKDKVNGDSSIDIKDVIDAMTRLDIIDAAMNRLSRDIDQTVVLGRLRYDGSHTPRELHFDEDSIAVSGVVTDLSVREVLRQVNSLTEFLNARLPHSVSVSLSAKLMPSITSRLISDWLNPSLPRSLEALQEYEQTASLVRNLADSLERLGWTGKKELQSWVDSVPYTWLQKQREIALAEVRKLCLKGIQDKRSVERVETQVVSGDDSILKGTTVQEEENEDWGAEWGQEDNEETRSTSGAKESVPKVEDDDADAWGWNEDEEATEEPVGNAQVAPKDEKPKEEDEDGEGWGWGDEEEAAPVHAEQSQAKTTAPVTVQASTKVNGEQTKKNLQGQRELTLREAYTITPVPEALLGMVQQVIADIEKLASSRYSGLDIGTAAGQLSSIPSLILAMYRAAAHLHYSSDIAGNMLIYNDCTRIADELRSLLATQASKDAQSHLEPHMRPSSLLYLDNVIKAIESFGKRAYGAEMESQRTIIKDLFDGAQGFAHCTIHPFAGECDRAVATTLDRIRDVHRSWQGILSHSALLQSLGSILSAVTGKMIADIEDMSDISEEQSQRLRHFCLEIAKMSELFTSQEGVSGQQGNDLTGIYTPNWFKFQYLSEILDSSLADIKYLWTDGELRLEMEADEVIDLIKALFAESDYRRKAIAEIRRTAGREW